MTEEHVIRVGSRKSELALIQTNHVISLLSDLYPEKKFEIVTMSTLGDKVLDIPLPKIGEKSLFTRELEAALATECVDFVVHSLKDLPTCLPDKMAIGAVLEREDPRDALVLHQEFKEHSLDTLPKDSVIGTSSLRRAAQLHKYYPHLKVENIRGNLNTRLKKLDDLNKFQAIILATAGLQRMGWQKRISKIISEEDILYAVGQGAIAVECRENDEETISLLKPLYDIHTAVRIIAERTFLKTLGGGCSAPVAVKTDLFKTNGTKHKLTMTGAVWSLDGTNELKEDNNCELQMNGKILCSTCPYKNMNYSLDKCTKTEDIECLRTCKKDGTIENACSERNLLETVKNNSSGLHASKKIKLNHDKIKIAEIEEIDPHDKCPVSIPIGADFMGKCPYLETHTISKCPVNGHVEGLNIDKCPYMKEGKFIIENEEKSEGVARYLFCGLVPHADISLETLKEAEKLGRKLAESLLNKGAGDIMAKAQSIIRNT